MPAGALNMQDAKVVIFHCKAGSWCWLLARLRLFLREGAALLLVFLSLKMLVPCGLRCIPRLVSYFPQQNSNPPASLCGLGLPTALSCAFELTPTPGEIRRLGEGCDLPRAICQQVSDQRPDSESGLFYLTQLTLSTFTHSMNTQ